MIIFPSSTNDVPSGIYILLHFEMSTANPLARLLSWIFELFYMDVNVALLFLETFKFCTSCFLLILPLLLRLD